MTHQEAIQALNKGTTDSGYNRAVVIAISALNRRIAKKPVKDGFDYICPSCKGGFLIGPDEEAIEEIRSLCCNKCGQMLDWNV